MKRGVSVIIAWVLLFGLSATLAILVGIWIKDQAQQRGEEIAITSDKDARCADTVLSAEVNCDENGAIINYDVTNRGSFTIHKVSCFGEINDFDDSDPDKVLKPGDSEANTLNSCSSENYNRNQVALVPVIKIGEEFIGCGDNSVILRC